MPVRIEVGYRDGVKDPRGERVVREAMELAGIELQAVRTISVYTVDVSLSNQELEMIASGPFTDPIIQEYAVGRPVGGVFDTLIEVGFRPGVTDNAGRSAGEAVSQLLGRVLEPDEVAALTLYLASEDARGITGQAFNICGGRVFH